VRTYVKKGGHGGSRRGAGRPSLRKRDRLLIGAEAEKEFRILGRSLPRHDLSETEIAESREALARVPVEDRKKLPAEIQEHLNWLQEELDGKRVVWAERRLLREVFARQAAKASKRYGRPISLRQMRRWRDQYLATRKSPEK